VNRKKCEEGAENADGAVKQREQRFPLYHDLKRIEAKAVTAVDLFLVSLQNTVLGR
jgi:hypothetical protein